MLYNQNNVAFEASPVTTEVEIQVGNDLCRMLGYNVRSQLLHGLQPISVDQDARMIVSGAKREQTDLRNILQRALHEKCPVTMVVAVIGSTNESSVEPLSEILALREELRAKGLEFVVHCDAA